MARLAVLLAGATLFAAFAVLRGQDTNWDLQNYHDYAAYALLHGRYALDVAPGNIQSYLNPLIELVPYELRHRLPGRLAAAVLGALGSLTVLAVWEVACAVIPGRGFARVLATLAGVCGAMAISEIGTSMSDLPLAALVAGALALLLRPGSARMVALAGGMIGVATGLKLTNAVFVPGLLAVLLMGQWRRIGWFGAGLAYGGLIAAGPWATYLAWHYDNPIFPGLNNLFESASAAAIEFADRRFLPHGVLATLAYPWRIAVGLHPTGELAFREPRLLAGLPLAAAWCGVRAMRRGDATPEDGALTGLATFVLISALVWLRVFAIQRYAVALDAMAGVLAVAVVARLSPAAAGPLAVPLAAVLLLGATQPADWWHRDWRDAYAPRAPALLRQPATIVIEGSPLGYWASALPAGSRFLSIDNLNLATGGVLEGRLANGIAHPVAGGGVWLMGLDEAISPALRARMGGLGLTPSGPCFRAESMVGIATVFCRALTGPPGDGVPALAAGQTADLSNRGAGWVFEQSGWNNADRFGVTALAGGGALILRPSGPGVLSMRLRDPGGPWRVATLCVSGIAQPRFASGVVLGSISLSAADPGQCPQR